MTDPEHAERLYTVAEVAALWRTSQEHVRREIRRNRLRAIRIGERAWRVPDSALVDYVATAEGSAELVP